MELRKLDTKSWCDVIEAPRWKDGEFYAAIIGVIVLSAILMLSLGWLIRYTIPVPIRILSFAILYILDIHRWFNLSTRITGKQLMMKPYYKTLKETWGKNK